MNLPYRSDVVKQSVVLNTQIHANTKKCSIENILFTRNYNINKSYCSIKSKEWFIRPILGFGKTRIFTKRCITLKHVNTLHVTL